MAPSDHGLLISDVKLRISEQAKQLVWTTQVCRNTGLLWR